MNEEVYGDMDLLRAHHDKWRRAARRALEDFTAAAESAKALDKAILACAPVVKAAVEWADSIEEVEGPRHEHAIETLLDAVEKYQELEE